MLQCLQFVLTDVLLFSNGLIMLKMCDIFCMSASCTKGMVLLVDNEGQPRRQVDNTSICLCMLTDCNPIVFWDCWMV